MTGLSLSHRLGMVALAFAMAAPVAAPAMAQPRPGYDRYHRPPPPPRRDYHRGPGTGAVVGGALLGLGLGALVGGALAPPPPVVYAPPPQYYAPPPPPVYYGY